MQAVALLALATVASAGSIAGLYGAINTNITVDMANQFKSIVERFDDCFTPPLSAVIKKVTAEELQQLVDLHNKLIAKEITVPTSRAEGLVILKQAVPSLYDDIVAANTDFESRLKQLMPEGQQHIYNLESGYFGVLKTRTQEGLVDYYLDVCHTYAALPAPQHDDFKKAFPETVSCLDEDLYKQMCNAAEQLKANNYKMDTKIMGLVGQIFQNKRFAKKN